MKLIKGDRLYYNLLDYMVSWVLPEGLQIDFALY